MTRRLTGKELDTLNSGMYCCAKAAERMAQVAFNHFNWYFSLLDAYKRVKNKDPQKAEKILAELPTLKDVERIRNQKQIFAQWMEAYKRLEYQTERLQETAFEVAGSGKEACMMHDVMMGDCNYLIRLFLLINDRNDYKKIERVMFKYADKGYMAPAPDFLELFTPKL